MADDSLKTPVRVSAIRISASTLPIGLSPTYQQYILSQALDFTNVANKANDAGQGAYDAQVKNDEQDVELADHEVRIQQLRIDVDDHEIRITANTNAISALDVRVTTVEGEIVTLQADVSALDGRVTTAEGNISDLQADYVSKSDTATQSLASPLNVTTSYSVGGTKVVGARQTGWTASTGTPNKSAFNADLAFTVSTTYTQSEIQAIASALTAERQRTKALEDALRNHGLIN